MKVVKQEAVGAGDPIGGWWTSNTGHMRVEEGLCVSAERLTEEGHSYLQMKGGEGKEGVATCEHREAKRDLPEKLVTFPVPFPIDFA